MELDRFKFRAWYKSKSEPFMLWRGLFDRNWYKTEFNDETGSHCYQGIHPDDKYDMIIMQSTGLKDINNKLAYEGDVLMPRDVNSVVDDCPDHVTHIIWDQGAFCIGTGMKQALYGHYVKRFEIIGNIHENPKLLETISNE